MTSPTSPTRRALLGTVGAGWLMATVGCDLTTADAPSTSEDAATGTADDVDERLLESVRAATLAAADLVSRTLDLHPALAGDLLALAELHAVHLEALSGETEVEPLPGAEDSAPTPPAARQAARRRVTDTENSLLTLLTRGAREAESGRFARLLASMAAGLTQQLSRSAGAA